MSIAWGAWLLREGFSEELTLELTCKENSKPSEGLGKSSSRRSASAKALRLERAWCVSEPAGMPVWLGSDRVEGGDQRGLRAHHTGPCLHFTHCLLHPTQQGSNVQLVNPKEMAHKVSSRHPRFHGSSWHALSPYTTPALSPVGASLSPPGKASPKIYLLPLV